MEDFRHLNLIRLFDFYLALIFLVGTVARWRQYRAVLGMVRAVPERWPHLFKLVRGHRSIFLTWSTVGPGLLALLLMLVQMIASRLIWPKAGLPHQGLTVDRLLENWLAAAVVLVL